MQADRPTTQTTLNLALLGEDIRFGGESCNIETNYKRTNKHHFKKTNLPLLYYAH